MNLFISFIIFISLIKAQAVPYIEPLSKKYTMKPNQFTHLELLKNKELELDCHTINDISVCQIGILLNDNNAIEQQITKSQEIISNFKTEQSSKIASSVIESYF